MNAGIFFIKMDLRKIGMFKTKAFKKKNKRFIFISVVHTWNFKTANQDNMFFKKFEAKLFNL